jgi:hypothetical protein
VKYSFGGSSQSNRSRARKTRIQIRKEEVTLSQFVDDMFPQNSTKTLLEMINSFSKVAGFKLNIKKSVSFLYSNNE